MSRLRIPGCNTESFHFGQSSPDANRSVQPENVARNVSSSFLECLIDRSVKLTAAKASIKSHSMSLRINIITKTALSVGGLVLFHSLR